MQPQVLLLLVFLLSGALIAFVSLPLIRGRIGRNYLYGFRTPKTLESDDVWYPANRYAGRELLRAGLVLALGALVLLPFAGRLSVDTTVILGFIFTLLPLGIALYRSFRYLSTL